MTDLVERLKLLDLTLDGYADRDNALAVILEAVAAIETLTREKSDQASECAQLCNSYLERALAAEARAEASESALREALDVVRPFADRAKGYATMDCFGDRRFDHLRAARAFIEKHAPAATSEDK